MIYLSGGAQSGEEEGSGYKSEKVFKLFVFIFNARNTGIKSATQTTAGLSARYCFQRYCDFNNVRDSFKLIVLNSAKNVPYLKPHDT
ncbi:hypothetical protein CDAR_226721 [Caerostris darwini]|uniref:LAGLIDADG homing endonuclease n=1 Tax=Caerostris darwini TaxID=1538125 RepID=A0AAV4UHW3_9ARAC|nr:hypothetical protein CDAR_226721 [Caerostris darwini]